MSAVGLHQRAESDSEAHTTAPVEPISQRRASLAHLEVHHRKSLELTGGDITESDFHGMLRSETAITLLRCVRCTKISADGFASAPYPPSITQAAFVHCSINEAGLRALATACKDLETVDISFCQALRIDDITKLQSDFSKIRFRRD